MKKILLLGDSIRMGYDKYVKEALEGTAEVYYPTENCKFSQYLLRFLHEWKRKFEWPDDIDLVHWNAGLWDVPEVYGEEPISSPAHYAEMIGRLDKRIRMLFPNAKVVFATSTAVREDGYRGVFRRYNATIERYNAIALDTLKDTDTVINDLYAHTKDILPQYCSDMTHYNTPEGAAYMGGKVLSVICGELGIAASEVNVEGFTLEAYSKENIGY